MRRSLVSGLIAVSLALSACSGGTPSEPGSSGSAAGESSQASAPGNSTRTEMRFAAIAPPESYVPGDFGTGPVSMYVQPVYDSLLKNDDEGEPQANLATEWSYDDSNTVLSLTLREDVTFTDGTPFNGDAVKANLEAAKAGTGESGGKLRFIDRVDVVDDTHVEIVLTAPDPSLLSSLGSMSGMVASPAALGSTELETMPVGSGPYVLNPDESQAGINWVFTRNPEYWNPEDYPFETLTVTLFNDTTAITNALRADQIDLFTVDIKEAASLEAAGLVIEQTPAYTASGIYLFDRAGEIVPALGDVRVRQAINHALDLDGIVEAVYQGAGTPTSQVFAVGSDAYLPELDDYYPYDVEKAKALMAEAGYAEGFELPMPDVSPIYPTQQAAVTEALQSIGITPVYQPVNGETFISDLLSAKYPAAIFGLDSHRPWDFAQLALTTEATWNPFHTEDPTVTSLIDEAQQQTGDEQSATFQELNTYIVEQAWFAPYVQANNVFVHPADISVKSARFSTWPPIWNIAPSQ